MKNRWAMIYRSSGGTMNSRHAEKAYTEPPSLVARSPTEKLRMVLRMTATLLLSMM
jgi:hypothetical protein